MTWLLKRKETTGFAEVVIDKAAVEARMCEYLKRVPMTAKPMGVKVENGAADSTDIARIAKEKLFVRIKI